jgi:hypothetical protein
MKKNLQLTQLITVIVFTAFLTVFGILFAVLPDREFSGLENRYLASPPKLTLSSLADGKFTSSFETYVSDQFPFREFWVGTKALTERVLLKTENNGVYFGRDGFLSGRFTIDSWDVLNANVSAVNTFAENAAIPIYFALIPGSGAVWRDKLPENSINADQPAIISDVYTQLIEKVETIDLYSVMENHSDEYVYFRTDHHWTQLGARYAAEALADALNLPAPQRYSETLLTDEFRGTAFNSSAAWWVKPDEINAYVLDAPVTAEDYNSGASQSASLYNPEFLSQPGKYQYFLGGNSPLKVIKTELDGAKLLIIRDSFSDALAPQLIESATEIHLIDLRYYKGSVAEYIEENSIDKALILYSVKNFCEDKNAALIQITR